MSALQKYEQRADAVKSLLCVGLDSDFNRLPARFQGEQYAQYAFNRWIIEQTHMFTSAYKPNIAFYEARGDQGLRELEMTMAYLREHHPDILTICDAKRADIGSTNAGYVTAVFDRMGFDAITLHPYLGREALQPFLERTDKACILLCRTSNLGAGDVQDLQVGDKPLWQVIAEKVAGEWNTHGNCMLVVGATYPQELAHVRRIVGEMTLLVPGIGAQGGEVQPVITGGKNSAGKGLIINASRSVIFAADPGAEAKLLRDEINQFR